MVFVYQGSGKLQSKNADVCQKQCIRFNGDLQWCLSRNNYQQKACAHFVEQWMRCCDGARAAEAARKLELQPKAAAAVMAASAAAAAAGRGVTPTQQEADGKRQEQE